MVSASFFILISTNTINLMQHIYVYDASTLNIEIKMAETIFGNDGPQAQMYEP